MRYWFLAGTYLTALCAVYAQSFRTPDGQLWAGTTFQLRATASILGQTVAMSPPAQVTVGQIAQWQIGYESSPLLSASGEDWFVLFVTNSGNGVDSLRLNLLADEGPNTTPWQWALFEQTEPDRTFSQGSAISESCVPVMPGERRRMFLRARPPSDRNTDGAFLSLQGNSLLNSQVQVSAPMAAGLNAPIGTQISYNTSTGSPILVSPYLMEGRLWWIQRSFTIARVMSTPQPITQTGTFSNNVRSEARIFDFVPTWNNTIVAGRWFVVSEQGELGMFFLEHLGGDARIYPVRVPLPQEAPLNPNAPIVSSAGAVYYVDQSGRVCLLDPVSWQVQVLPPTSASPVISLKTLRDGSVVAIRSNGRFDIIQGATTILANLRIPNSGDYPVIGVDYDSQRARYFVSSRSALGVWNILRNKWDWRWFSPVPLVSEPVHTPDGSAVLVVDAEGVLHGFSAKDGRPLPLYPQPVFEKTMLERAHLTVVSRRDRGVAYVYIAGQASDGSVCFSLVTLVNPLNRFRFQTPGEAVLGESLLLTGDSDSDYLLGWVYRGGAGDPERGAFYGFRLR